MRNCPLNWLCEDIDIAELDPTELDSMVWNMEELKHGAAQGGELC